MEKELSLKMNKRTLIIGEHSLTKHLLRRCEDERAEVRHLRTLTSEDIEINEFGQLYLLARKNDECRSLVLLEKLAATYDVAIHKGVKLRCHILVKKKIKEC